jgi:hypothetical protein
MPLLDHFHPPLSQRRPWESFHTTWCTALADLLNRDVLPPGYIALEQIHAGAPVEIDVATYEDEAAAPAGPGGTATLARPVWTPAAPPLVLPAVFPDGFTVEVRSTEGGRSLVAAVELVSPGNKDRGAKRRLFTAKCASYLARGVGLVVVDVVTSRHGNLHDELSTLLGVDPASHWTTPPPSLYAVAYRPVRRDDQDQFETWPVPLAVGQGLPTLPLSLQADLCVPLDLEAAYRDACQRRRLDEVNGAG